MRGMRGLKYRGDEFFNDVNSMNERSEIIKTEKPKAFPPKHNRTYLLRLATEMFSNLEMVRVQCSHNNRSLHCQVKNPHDGRMYDVIIIPPDKNDDRISNNHRHKENNGTEKAIGSADRVA